MSDVYIDLDGTLLECRRRLHTVFCQVSGVGRYPVETYWNMKRIPRSNRSLLEQEGWSGDRIGDFEAEWLSVIEESRFLALDEVHPGVLNALQQLRHRFSLRLLTARQSPGAVHEQLHMLGLHHLFDELIVTGRGKSKVDTLRARVDMENIAGILVGDTGEDVQTARALGLRAFTVENGFRCAHYLRRCTPDASFASFADFSDHLLKR